MIEHYLDWAASAPPYVDILLEAADMAAKTYGNPSSPHGAGKAARRLLDDARTSLAGIIGASYKQIVFTSGGTEADSIPLLSLLRKGKPVSIVIGQTEHPAVYEQASLLEELGVTVLRVKPCKDGIFDPNSLADAIRKDTALVAMMAVNNETGAIQPIESIVKAVAMASRDAPRPPFFHCDAVQALGTIGFDSEALGVDGAAFSGHKLGGPRGIGALYLKHPLRPLTIGGGQESGHRPGTHNTLGAWAFAQAAKRNKESLAYHHAKARLLECKLLQGITAIQGATVLPFSRKPGEDRFSPFIVSVAFPGLGGEVMTRLLDAAGMAVSTGSACSSGKKDRRVLDAMGIDADTAFSSIRVSIGRDTSEDTISRFLELTSDCYTRYKV
ncbi:cysteine desulfurase family protein [Spirochaetota bacterium]